MTPEDAARLTEICLPDGAWTSSDIRGCLDLPTTRFFFREAGFLLARVVSPEAEILLLAVAPEARRQGVGSGLLDALIAALEEEHVTDIFLEVSFENPAAIALYARAGFAVTGRRKGYYRRHDRQTDAVLMSRTAKSS